MGEAFSNCEPFLDGGEFFPAAGADLPFHEAGNIIAGKSGVLADNAFCVGEPAPVMGKDLSDTFLIISGMPVPWQCEFHRVVPYPEQAFQIVSE